TFYLWKSKYKEFRISSAQREELNAKLGELARDAIDQQGSRFRLSESSIRQFLGDPDEEGSLFWLATKIGWLVPVGLMAENPHEKAYTFFHPTFQEYFAACAIDDWDYFLNHVPQNPKASYRIFEQQWKEVFLLWLGRPKKEVPDEEKEAFITALVEFEDRCQGFYTYRAYFLAAASITEFGNCSRADEITSQLVKWDSCEPYEQNEELYKSFYCFEQGVKAALQETDRTKAVNAFVHLLRTNQDELTRLSIATSLGEIGAGNLVPIASRNSDAMETATYWLMHIALDEVIPRVGQWLLRQIAPGNFNLINVLISSLPAIVYEAICLQIASRFLIEIEPDNQNAINILIELLLKSQSKEIRQQAVYLLGEFAFANLNAINVMTELLYTCQDEDERLGIAVNLGKINPSNPEAIAVLAELLHTCKDEKERRWIANKLGEIDFGNPEAITALTELLHTCQDENELEFIISSLGEINTDDLDTIKALIELMYTSQNYRILWANAHSLELIVRGYLFGEVVSGLRECLQEPVDENIFATSLATNSSGTAPKT
ncbi:MAG: HEAT repeat domain-containing protein, partial [Cyanobacteriota bacterium]